METRTGYRYIAPADPDAETACRLTSESVRLRKEPPEDFFAAASSQQVLANGYELRYPAVAEMYARVDTFVAEEMECCPFFAFERWEEDGELVLRILRVDDEGSTS